MKAILQRHAAAFLSLVFTSGSSLLLHAVDPTAPFNPKIDPASDAPFKAMKAMKLPPGLQIELFAAEPMVANEKVVHLLDANSKPFDVAREKIVQRHVGLSALPTNLKDFLSKAELRDLVEFFVSLKEPAKASK